MDQAAARATSKTKLSDSKPFSLKYKAKGVSDGGFQSLKGPEDGDGSGGSVNYSIDPSRQGAFAINEPTGDEALVVIDPVRSHPIPAPSRPSNFGSKALKYYLGYSFRFLGLF